MKCQSHFNETCLFIIYLILSSWVRAKQKVVNGGEICPDSVEQLGELLNFLNCCLRLMDWGETFSPLLFDNSAVNRLKSSIKLAHHRFVRLGSVQPHKNLHAKFSVVGN